jgi:hypothetical protein
MDRNPPPFDPGNGVHPHGSDEWAQILTRTIGHLAAQLTMAQIRLRALASELHDGGTVEAGAVATRVRALAAVETGGYLRENLGEALIEVIDVDALEHDLVAYLSDPENS